MSPGLRDSTEPLLAAGSVHVLRGDLGINPVGGSGAALMKDDMSPRSKKPIVDWGRSILAGE